ncbi:MAG: hypothetical protein J7527_15165 [Chitinophagaceae bacterium]|nr:hypothetical protein [Chitinophagaceae bacterium]
MFLRPAIIFFLIIFLSAPVSGQVSPAEKRLLQKLDSLSASQSPAAPFADLYFNTMINALQFFQNADDSARECMRRLQACFTQSFFAAADSFALQQKIPASWQNYYADTSLSAIRHVLLGINAHINGDIWQALITSFSYEKLIRIRPLYFSYYHSLLDIYDNVYEEIYHASRTLRTLHTASAGLDKWYGKKLLHRWLKRQMKLACLFYSNNQRFRKKQAKLHRKMHRLDKAILRHF